MGAFKSIEDALGKSVGRDKVLRVTGKDSKGKTCIDVECLDCGNIRNLQFGRFNFGTARKCDCKVARCKLLKVGMEVGTDKIVDEARRNNRKAFVMKCKICGETRVIERYKIGTELASMCECVRSNNRKERHQECINKYSKYIGKYNADANAFIIDFYSKSDTNGILVKVKCKSCGKEREMLASVLITSKVASRCECDSRRNEFANKSRQERNNIIDKKYSGYIGKTSGKLKVIGISHENNEHKFICSCSCNPNVKHEYSISHITGGYIKSCGCTRSFGESYIKTILQSKSIKYKSEVSFDGLVGLKGGKLRYDIGLLDSYNNVIGLIEFDGSQHYFDNGSFGNKVDKKLKMTQFEITKEHDKLKNKFAYDFGIPLFRFTRIIDDGGQTELVLDLFIEQCRDNYEKLMEVVKND